MGPTRRDHSLHPAFSTSPGSPFESLALQERMFPKRLKVSYSALLSMLRSKFRTWFGCRCAKPRKNLCQRHIATHFFGVLQQIACDCPVPSLAPSHFPMKKCHFPWVSWGYPLRWTRHDTTLAILTECATKTFPRPPELFEFSKAGPHIDCFNMSLLQHDISCLKQHKSGTPNPRLQSLPGFDLYPMPPSNSCEGLGRAGSTWCGKHGPVRVPWRHRRLRRPRRPRLDARVVQGVQGTLSITDAVEIHIASEKGCNKIKITCYPPELGPPIRKRESLAP